MDHAQGCTETSKVPNCFACHMESEKEKYGDNVQFFSGDTLTVEVTEDGKLQVIENFYEKISEEFFKKEWSSYEGNWDFRELLRYLSDRRIEISINKGSLWIELPEKFGGNIEILLYSPMNEYEEDCEKIYKAFSLMKEAHNSTVQDIKNFIS